MNWNVKLGIFFGLALSLLGSSSNVLANEVLYKTLFQCSAYEQSPQRRIDFFQFTIISNKAPFDYGPLGVAVKAKGKLFGYPFVASGEAGQVLYINGHGEELTLQGSACRLGIQLRVVNRFYIYDTEEFDSNILSGSLLVKDGSKQSQWNITCSK